MDSKLKHAIETAVKVFPEKGKIKFHDIRIDNTDTEEGRVVGSGSIIEKDGAKECSIEVHYTNEVIDGTNQVTIMRINKTH